MELLVMSRKKTPNQIAREIAYECSKDLGIAGTGWGKHLEFVTKALRQVELEAYDRAIFELIWKDYS